MPNRQPFRRKQETALSGLGLEAQRKAVEDFLNGGNWRLMKEFVEVESGKKSDRPQLAKAFQLCRLTGAKLVIAKKWCKSMAKRARGLSPSKMASMMALRCESERPRNHNLLVNTKLHSDGR